MKSLALCRGETNCRNWLLRSIGVVSICLCLLNDPAIAHSFEAQVLYESGGISYLNDVDIISNEHGWGVGSLIAEWDGQRWTRHPATDYLLDSDCDTNNLRSVDFVDESFGIAIGDNGLALVYERAAWKAISTFTFQDLWDLDLLSRTEGWAIEYGGGIWRYGADKWTKVETLTGKRLTAISFNTPDNGWIVGDVLLHFDGVRWSEVNPDLSKRSFVFANAISFDKNGDAWIVGASGLVQRYNDTTWTELVFPISNVDLWDIAFDETGRGWIGARLPHGLYGKSPLFNWNGKEWKDVSIACFSEDIICPYRNGPRSVAFGVHTNGAQIRAIDFSSQGGLAVGGPMLIKIGEYPELVGFREAYRINDIDVAKNNEGWSVGNCGVILNLSNGTWNQVISPLDCVDIIRITTKVEKNAWALSSRGHILRYISNHWNIIANVQAYTNDMILASDSAGWIVGATVDGSGVVIRFDNEIWNIDYRVREPNSWLADIDDDDRGNIWAVGSSGTVLRYDGGKWSGIIAPTTEDLLHVFAFEKDHVVVVGVRSIFVWNNGTWSRMTLPEITEQERIVSAAFLTPSYGVILIHEAEGLTRSRLMVHNNASWNTTAILGCDMENVRILFDLDQPYYLWVLSEYSTIVRIPVPIPEELRVGIVYLPRVLSFLQP